MDCSKKSTCDNPKWKFCTFTKTTLNRRSISMIQSDVDYYSRLLKKILYAEDGYLQHKLEISLLRHEITHFCENYLGYFNHRDIIRLFAQELTVQEIVNRLL